jgi:hypothetical protein
VIGRRCVSALFAWPTGSRSRGSSASDAGYDSVLLQNYVRPGGKIPEEVVVVRDLNQLRSPEAAFDPAKKDSPNIMASIGGIMVPAAALLARELMRDPAKEQ